ncbi:ABC1 kinase family protein [Actinomadura geliboluensis]|uniref:ABC1 kinase family protein n=1 Tax=Actinomadura geliboluensis TaxID=882440 RepID=UPI00260B3FB7|nr:AarF/UbiB family protein [Actinomadura geliboluensis]
MGRGGGPAVRRPAARFVRIVALGAPALVRLAVIGARHRGGARADRSAAEVARLLERLGGTFVKAGQLLGTRTDLVGTRLAAALGRLHDDIEPAPAAAVLAEARAGLGALPGPLAEALARPPVAGGSIAAVYRAELDGRVLAVKVRRPGVREAVAGDLAILDRLARAAVRLPALRRLPLVEMVGQLGALLLAQVDFEAEAANLRRLRNALDGTPGVLVPEPVAELCGGGVITMEYVPGLDRAAAAALPAETRRAQTTALVRAVYRLLFVEGLVHIDLHHGNVYFRADGSVVLLDAGLVFRMSDAARRDLTDFFAAMARGDGEGCAAILLSTVRGAAPDADLAGFRSRVAALVARNAGAPAGAFRLSAFCYELFALQRDCRLHAEPEFALPMLSLLSLEGTVQANHPGLDFQLEAAPYAWEGLIR